MAEKKAPFAQVRFGWIHPGGVIHEQDVVVCTPDRVRSLLRARPALRDFSRHDLSDGSLVVFLEDPHASGVLSVDRAHAERSRAFDREMAAMIEPPREAGRGRRRRESSG